MNGVAFRLIEPGIHFRAWRDSVAASVKRDVAALRERLKSEVDGAMAQLLIETNA